MKIKSLSDLGHLYENIATATQEGQHDALYEKAEHANDSLLTDATQYVPGVKAGSPLGGGPGAKKESVNLAAKTGPAGLKGNNFDKVDKKKDPGSDTKEMEKVEEGEDEDPKGNVKVIAAAKITTPKEKVNETAGGDRKYNYNPQFTMAKPKFDQLYEEAIKRIPFTENSEGGEDIGVPPASDVAADDGAPVDASKEPSMEEETVTAEEAVSCLEKVLKFLKKQTGEGSGDGEMGAGEDSLGSAGSGDGVVAEKIDAEEGGSVGPGGSPKKGKPDSVGKIQTVGSIKKTTGTATNGSIKIEPDTKEMPALDKSRMNPKSKMTVGSIKDGGLFEQ